MSSYQAAESDALHCCWGGLCAAYMALMFPQLSASAAVNITGSVLRLQASVPKQKAQWNNKWISDPANVAC